MSESTKLAIASWALCAVVAVLYFTWDQDRYNTFTERCRDLSSWLHHHAGYQEIMLTAIFIVVVGIGRAIRQQRAD